MKKNIKLEKLFKKCENNVKPVDIQNFFESLRIGIDRFNESLCGKICKPFNY